MEAAKKRPDRAPLVITGGDPAGIGPEILLNIAPDLGQVKASILYFCTAGSAHQAAFVEACESFGARVRVVPGSDQGAHESRTSPTEIEPASISLVDLASAESEVAPGRPEEASGRLAFRALKLASDWIKKNGCSGLLTAPVAKEWIARGAGLEFPGHTDYLAERFGGPVLMLMHGRENSVVPLTIHIPLSRVPGALRKTLDDPATTELLQRLRTIPAYSGDDGRRWALCGLNPHAGEGGHLGREEIDFMNQRVAAWRAVGLPVDGPLPADGVFMKANRSRFRLILSCYHDQGLAPFKALEGTQGVNCTIGLPFPRTSPDHGTGFDIAGQAKADPRSMRRALEILTTGELAVRT